MKGKLNSKLFVLEKKFIVLYFVDIWAVYIWCMSFRRIPKYWIQVAELQIQTQNWKQFSFSNSTTSIIDVLSFSKKASNTNVNIYLVLSRVNRCPFAFLNEKFFLRTAFFQKIKIIVYVKKWDCLHSSESSSN